MVQGISIPAATEQYACKIETLHTDQRRSVSSVVTTTQTSESHQVREQEVGDGRHAHTERKCEKKQNCKMINAEKVTKSLTVFKDIYSKALCDHICVFHKTGKQLKHDCAHCRLRENTRA